MSTQDDINNFGPSNNASDLLTLAAQTANTTTNRIVSVATVNDLPDLANGEVEPGTIFYVEDLRIPIIAQPGRWTGLDNRTLRSDFSLKVLLAWGNNNFGQLGTNEGITSSRSSPVAVVGGFTDWCQISAGSDRTIGLRENGTAWAWGCNGTGRLGDNTTITRSSPVAVVGGFTDWCQISAGRGTHTLGVRNNGTAWAWGSNQTGRLGTGNTISASSPVSVIGGFTDWRQVGAGFAHSLGVRINGTAWAWGFNGSGRLGDNSITDRSSPVSVVGGFTDWCQVSAGVAHSLGLRTNCTAWAWGCNPVGQLGDISIVSKLSPVSVAGGFTDWCQISAGSYHSLGLRTNGTVWAWGCNGDGRLGDNNNPIFHQSSPVSVVGGFTDWCQISAGGSHSLGMRTNSTVWAWGFNQNGQLGDNTVTAKSSPVSVVGGITDWCQISAGGTASIALRIC
jgi:alpha-tubulin suppressor-like RCC1 family protein